MIYACIYSICFMKVTVWLCEAHQELPSDPLFGQMLRAFNAKGLPWAFGRRPHRHRVGRGSLPSKQLELPMAPRSEATKEMQRPTCGHSHRLLRQKERGQGLVHEPLLFGVHSCSSRALQPRATTQGGSFQWISISISMNFSMSSKLFRSRKPPMHGRESCRHGKSP